MLALAVSALAPASAEPAVTPSASPSATPHPAATGVEAKHLGETYLWAAYPAVTSVNNDYTNGFHALPSPRARFASTFPLFGQIVMIQGDFTVNGFGFSPKTLTASNGTIVAQTAGVYHEDDETSRVGVRISTQAPIFVAISTLYASPPVPLSHQPDLVGSGIGFEAMPDLWRSHTLYGRLYYYPKIEAEDNFPFYVRYVQFDYELGFARRIGRSNTFYTTSIQGEHRRSATLTPAFIPAKSQFASLDLGYLMRI